MTDETKLELKFGRQTFPEDVRAVWGARLIWPADLLHDRQDLQSHDEDAKHELVIWLNYERALAKALDKLRNNPYSLGLRSNSSDEAVIYEDDDGKLVGSAQASYGYLYVCAWLHKHTAQAR